MSKSNKDEGPAKKSALKRFLSTVPGKILTGILIVILACLLFWQFGPKSAKNAILKDGRAKAGAEYTKMVEEARKEADSILADARKNADAETARRMGETKKDLAALVAEAAGKMVVSGEGEDVDLKLFDEFIEKMGE